MGSNFDAMGLISEIEQEIEKGEDLRINDDKQGKYKQYIPYLKILNKKLEKDKYKFVFIGRKGIGKTTTILNLFDLINGQEELLSTGSGGTTVCEVEIRKSEEQYSYFEIIPIEDKYMNQYISDFCSAFLKTDDSSNLYVPTEIGRSIRNMLGMKVKEIESLCEQFDNFECFKDEVVRRLNLPERTNTIVKCEQDNNGKYFSDIQKKFTRINLGKEDTVKIPNKIILYATEDLIDFGGFSSVISIVDTRGIDSDIAAENEVGSFKREDILNYIDNQQDDCILIFVDSIKSAPSQEILETIKTRITKENRDNFYIFINVNGDEAEKVMTDDGVANDIQTGIDFKTDDILSKMKQERVDFNERNLIFFNSKTNSPDKKDILGMIESNGEIVKQRIFEECQDVKNAFEKLKYDFEDGGYAMKNFEELYEDIIGRTSPQNILAQVVKDFVDNEIRKIHPSRLDAINRYRGDYYAYNFYHRFSNVIEKTFDHIFGDAKNDLIKKVNEILGYKNISKLDEIDYKMFIKGFNEEYLLRRDELKALLKRNFLSSFQGSSWARAQALYGDGKGYVNNVCSIYANEIMRLDISYNLKNNFDDAWNKILQRNELVKQ
ncbi:hypothetical protein [Tumebacillus permanentifrigoris]|uniref:Dynamin family protein n=1 Tax=Tumebacillus permanentifrigoris TaxID=378543 RepID=A0A316DBP1_9BACL|nr:hypothetical protein [Tumebacillus permanentifrigoris]PWK14502.1 hypothetical protein C7459_105269 [Tumebacillus permanentifrigoris]